MNRHVSLLIVLFWVGVVAQAQFRKERIQNLQTFDMPRYSWGYYLGFNVNDFKIDLKDDLGEILVDTELGFNVGLIGNLRLNNHFDLRFEPGLNFTSRVLHFPGFAPDSPDATRDVESTYIHFPLLLKFSALRLNNFKPFLVAGLSTSINLAADEDNKDDNSAGVFRMKTNTYYYELGFGIDFYTSYFKFTPSIRGVFALNDELVRDADPNSPWTGNIESLKSRGVFINFTFQ
ncbi:MAG: PorT family protein [Bacteroidetes bacterium]|nr:PorT family protein [Bacteroidota bacterium]